MISSVSGMLNFQHKPLALNPDADCIDITQGGTDTIGLLPASRGMAYRIARHCVHYFF